MTFEKIEYCRDRGFPTKHIPLPLTLLLSDDLEICVNYARTDQLPDVLGMVELAEKRGKVSTVFNASWICFHLFLTKISKTSNKQITYCNIYNNQ